MSGRNKSDPLLKVEFEVAANENQHIPRCNQTRKKQPRITLRLSDDEDALLKVWSEGSSASAYIRQCVFGEQVTHRKRQVRRPVQDKAALAKTLALLGQSRIANNLNQLAYQANISALIVDKETLAQINEAYCHIIAMRNELIRALGLKENQ